MCASINTLDITISSKCGMILLLLMCAGFSSCLEMELFCCGVSFERDTRSFKLDLLARTHE